MGKTDKKIKKNKEKLQTAASEKHIEEVLKTADQLIAEEKYAEAINTLAALTKEKCLDYRFMYDCAICYFMLGDYERAGQWVNNTLNVKGDSVKARILLGRLCLMQDRVNDALTIFEFIVDNLTGKISPEDREDLESVLEYYGSVEKDLICSEFPGLAELLGLNAVEEEPAEEEPLEEVEEAEATEEALAADDDEDSGQWEKSVDELIEEIMTKDISLIEKIKVLNNFAGSYFMLLEYEEARKLLEAAIKIDTQNMVTIRNMAYLLLAQGNGDEALKWAARLPMADFGLLYEMQCQG